MARLIKVSALKVPEVGLQAHCRDLILAKINFLLWDWNWASEAIVQEWYNNGLPKPPSYRGNLETGQIWDCKKVLERCADDDGDFTFDRESVRQHIGLIQEGSACYLSPFLINFYRGMDLLTVDESRVFLLRNVAEEGEEVVSANEVDTDPEGELHNLPQQRRKRPKGKQESRPRKRRRIDEAVVAEERWRRAASLELRLTNSRAKSKIKASRLILEADSSTESRAATSRGHPT
ncbi:hypothetical protein AXG93_3022s1090 [Marchantia polymorpha subsp. ruderalis]|uniref:Uncharacterized protein n=1 Tax=Marchantia polymorpha subsp. ruderalis TaxID=1480154 RepID=A0A176VG46_MARPO|nr:hypothetical protein AXG93_3022s1090 [Marchantia polymorpha subsp. ruderalis]